MGWGWLHACKTGPCTAGDSSTKQQHLHVACHKPLSHQPGLLLPHGQLAGSLPVPNCRDLRFINLTRKRKSGKQKAPTSEAG